MLVWIPWTAARQAADRRVRVFTIGFGTTRPTPLACTPQQFGGEALGLPRGGLHLGGGGGASPRRGNRSRDRRSDPPVDRQDHGRNLRPGGRPRRSWNGLRDLPMRIYTVKEVHELTVYLLALGALLAMGAMATSRWWNRFS